MKPKDPKRQLRGAINKAKGKNFEQYVDRSFDYYAMKGLAIVDKTPEPMQIVKPLGGGKFVAFFAKHAQPDYKGTLRGGKTVVMEAKYTTTDRLEQGRVKEGQADYLTRHQQLGALCYVIAGFGSGAVYRIPWDVWKNMKELFGRKYVREEDLKEYQVTAGSNGLLRLLD